MAVDGGHRAERIKPTQAIAVPMFGIGASHENILNLRCALTRVPGCVSPAA
jgi:hypothetical protein